MDKDTTDIGKTKFRLTLVNSKNGRTLESITGFGQEYLDIGLMTIRNWQWVYYSKIDTKIYLQIKHNGD